MDVFFNGTIHLNGDIYLNGVLLTVDPGMLQRLDAIEITLLCLAVIFGLTFIRNLLFSSRYK